jgi:hypothetical protein
VSILSTAIGVFARARMAQIRRLYRDPARVQGDTLKRLLRAARETEWGQKYGYASIENVRTYQARVPLSAYLDFRPIWDGYFSGRTDLTWRGRPRYFAKTSGTTAGDKYIPLSEEAVASHQRAGVDCLVFAIHSSGRRDLLDGRLFFLGGSTSLEHRGFGIRVGDLSGVMSQQIPFPFRGRYLPGPKVALIDDWEHKIAAMARQAIDQDVRLIAGMPSWMIVLLTKLLDEHERRFSWRPDSLAEVWPNLQLYIHGGVDFRPYRSFVEELIGRPLDLLEVYPASEGFLAIQDRGPGEGMLLMLDYGIFYEFVPLSELAAAEPRRLTVAEIEVDVPYAVYLTSNSGLWSYALGDVVKFVTRDPPRLLIVGRTSQWVNAFGENVIVEEVEGAIADACRKTCAEIVDFTVAPVYASVETPLPRHQWAIEFRRHPAQISLFALHLDDHLQACNTDYRTHRRRDVAMAAPLITTVEPDTFHEWLRDRRKLGGQHKVPRASNTREIIDEVLAISASKGAMAGDGVSAGKGRSNRRSRPSIGRSISEVRSDDDREDRRLS